MPSGASTRVKAGAACWAGTERGGARAQNLCAKTNEQSTKYTYVTRTSGPTMNLDTAPETAPAIPESSAAGRAEYFCPLDDDAVRRSPPITR